MTSSELDETVEGTAGEEGEGEPRAEVIVDEGAPERAVALEDIEPEGPTEEAVGPPEVLRPATVEIIRERTAEWLAKATTVVFAIVVVGFLLGSFLNLWLVYLRAPAARTDSGTIPSFDQVLDIAETLLPYLATPLGVALGYYFTKRAAGR